MGEGEKCFGWSEGSQIFFKGPKGGGSKVFSLVKEGGAIFFPRGGQSFLSLSRKRRILTQGGRLFSRNPIGGASFFA